MVTKTSHLPIRYFLALLWAHPILDISTIRVNSENFPNESYKMGFFSKLQSNFRAECCQATFRVTAKQTQAQEHSQYEYWPLYEAVLLIRREGGLSLISCQRNNIIYVSLLSPTPVHTWEVKTVECQLRIRWWNFEFCMLTYLLTCLLSYLLISYLLTYLVALLNYLLTYLLIYLLISYLLAFLTCFS